MRKLVLMIVLSLYCYQDVQRLHQQTEQEKALIGVGFAM